MKKDALEFLRSEFNTAAEKKVIKNDDGQTFIAEDYREYKENNLAKEAIITSTLSSVSEYLKTNLDNKQMFVHIASPDEVRVLGPLDKYGRREELLVAKTVQKPFYFGEWLDAEELNIALQSQFVDKDDRAILLQFIGNLREENAKTSTDDGVTQVAQIRTGVATVGDAKVPNPVTLAPFRTFPEVKQPSSQFVFRMRNGMQATLFEADNGAWRNEAISNIKGFFKQENPEINVLG